MSREKYVVLSHKDAPLGEATVVYDALDEARAAVRPGNAIVALVFALVDTELVEVAPLPVFFARVQIVSGIDGSTVAEEAWEIEAHDEEEAGRLAEEKARATVYFDERIDPQLRVVELEEKDG